jgi:hypothetical protein
MLSIADNAANRPQTVALSGTGTDFSTFECQAAPNMGPLDEALIDAAALHLFSATFMGRCSFRRLS